MGNPNPAAKRSAQRARSSSVRRAAAPLTAVALLSLCCSLASAEVSQRDGVRVSVTGKMSPTKLPRTGAAPIGVSVAGQIASTNPGGPPQLRKLTIAINRHGRLDAQGLPRCRLARIGGAAACPSPQVEVQMWNRGVKVEAPFFMVSYR